VSCPRLTSSDRDLTSPDRSFYSGPLRNIFNNLGRLNILGQVQTLILDGLAVTAEMVYEILREPSYNVRILSLRDTQHLNERLLCSALKTVCRASRPRGTPKLKALYFFTPQEPEELRRSKSGGIGPPSEHPASLASFAVAMAAFSFQLHSQLKSGTYQWGGGSAWYEKRGKMLPRASRSDWATTLLDCRGAIAFDAVLCNGPSHHNSPVFGTLPVSPGVGHFAVANYSVSGCEDCGGAPEGWTVWGEQLCDEDGNDLGRFPLLSPTPLFSSHVRVAQCPVGQSPNPSRFRTPGASTGAPRFIARCGDCLRDRYCHCCSKWWCEACYQARMLGPETEPRVKVRADGICDECKGFDMIPAVDQYADQETDQETEEEVVLPG